MTTKHMLPYAHEQREDTAILFMLTMMYLTMPPGARHNQLWMAARSNDRRWMMGRQPWHPDAALLDLDYYRELSTITFDI